MKNILYLASKSPSRQKLLKESGIDFKIIDQDADESIIKRELPLSNLVEKIATYKMDHVILQNGAEAQVYFVLTADTLGIDTNGNICGKPIDKQDAINKIKSYKNGAQTCSGFCLDRKIWKNDKWLTAERIVYSVCSEYIFDVPDDFIEKYFELSLKAGIDYMQVSGAVAVEEFGAQFLKYINGSYSAIVGLPMYELRQSLTKIGFFKE